MVGIIPVEHTRRDVGNVSSCIALARDIDFELGDSKNLLEIEKKVVELLCDSFLGPRTGLTNGEANADGIFDPRPKPKTKKYSVVALEWGERTAKRAAKHARAHL